MPAYHNLGVGTYTCACCFISLQAGKPFGLCCLKVSAQMLSESIYPLTLHKSLNSTSGTCNKSHEV